MGYGALHRAKKAGSYRAATASVKGMTGGNDGND
jgi:hypothetical protein